ncbi:hypothetical protein [Pseudomonas mosselii]|uniref:hypothetical protein n=1 Tax=Pseudomonas mosselii TaxID=78327 RepID=UPI00300C1A53
MLLSGTKKNGIATPSKWLLATYCILIIFRFWLTGDRDIVATNSPYDEYWYIDSASRYIWGGGYTHMAFAQIPTYSIWLLVLSLAGIPARLGIDALWIFSSLYLAIAITRFTRWKSAGLVTFVALALHPYAIMILDRGLAETLLAALSVMTLAAGLEIWNTQKHAGDYSKQLASILYIAGFAAAYLTRKEGIVLLAPLIVLLIVSLLDRNTWWTGHISRKLGVKLLVAPVIATLLAGSLLSLGNYSRLHFFALNELSAPGYQSAIKALNSIDVGRTPRHATVTAAARAQAYEISPTFRELAPFFEGPLGQSIAAHPIAGVNGEIGNGWFYWALRDAGANIGWFTSAKAADKKYAQIARDINTAFDEGKLKKRPYVFSTFVDPDMGKWVALVPDSTWNIYQLLTLPRYQFEPLIQTATPRQLEKYVAIDGKRRLRPAFEISGWVAAPANSQMALGSEDPPSSWTSIGPESRPDISVQAYPFRLTSNTPILPTQIYLKDAHGNLSSASLANVSAGDNITLHGNVAYSAGIDEIPKPEITRLDKVFGDSDNKHTNNQLLYDAYNDLGYLLSFAIVAGIVVALVTRHKSGLLLILLCTAGLAARCVVLGILDASSWPGTQVRYVFPALPFFICAGVMGMYVTARALQVVLCRKRA